MKIVRIFGGTFAVRRDGTDGDAFQNTFRQWQDVEYLESFFEANQTDLRGGFFGRIGVEEAVLSTISEAKRLEMRFLEIARMPAADAEICLEEMFRPLDDLEWRPKSMSRRKAKGPRNKSWLRLYAVRIEQGVYVVSGGAIKLTHKLQDRAHTVQALKRLDECVRFLQAEGIVDLESIGELIL